MSSHGPRTGEGKGTGRAKPVSLGFSTDETGAWNYFLTKIKPTMGEVILPKEIGLGMEKGS